MPVLDVIRLAGEQLQVFYPVVIFNLILVVYHFFFCQVPTQNLLHNQAVL